MSLYTLVYCSFATSQMKKQELADLLMFARQRNEELNVTGILLYHKRFFIQVLEGEKSVVQDLFNKIRRDDRHYNVHIMHQGEISHRSFEGWSMGFKVMVDEEISNLPGFTNFLSQEGELNESFVQNSQSVQLIDTFKRLYVM